MTPFQRPREEALAYRKKLFSERWDEELSAKQLIDAALSDLDLDLVETNPNDPSLCSADALFDKNRRQIVVRNDVTDEERAFLVSHEIGHDLLHVSDGSGCHRIIATALNPSNGETSGATKIEAYGARERAELQANVFGREFLLPRTVARKLFAGGADADGISKRIKVPLELVRLQLLDALLLPDVEPQKQESRDPIVPTTEQLQAAGSTSLVSLVVAGPGTGKTTTLMLRIRHLLDKKVPAKEILVLTFSNRAARELLDRLHELNTSNASEIWVGTFHAFGLEFLRKHHEVFELAPNFGVADKLAQIAILEPALEDAGLKAFSVFGDPLEWLPNVVDTIQRVKDELATAKEYVAHVKKGAGSADQQVTQMRNDVAALYRLYEKRKRATGRLVDFGDLIMLPTLALESNRDRFESNIGRFKHVLVDEYQDVNRASARLIRVLSAEAESLWVVGDPRQAIYRFRGASMRNVVRFETDFPKHKTFDLTENRRSHEEIIKVFEHAGKDHPLQMDLPLGKVAAIRGSSGMRPVRMICEDRQTMIEALAARVREHRESGIRYGNQVVLCSTNKGCSEAGDTLNDRGVPALHLGDVLARNEIRDLMSLLQLLVDRSASPLVRIAKWPGFDVTLDDLSHLLNQLRVSRVEPLTWGENIPKTVSEKGQAALRRVLTIFNGLSSSQSPWDVLCELLLGKARLMDMYLPGDDIKAITRRMAIWQFVHFTRIPDGAQAYQTAGSFLNRLRRRIRLNEDRELRILPPEAELLDAVTIMTIHGSKGLEFDSVHLYDADQFDFKRRDDSNELIPASLLDLTGDADELDAKTEGANKLYVALSRARSYLTIYEDQGRWNADPVGCVKAVPHLYETRQLRRQNASTAGGVRSVGHFAPTTRKDGKEFSDSELLTYMVCPRRHHYEYGIGLTPRHSLPITLEIERAVMGELFTGHAGTDHDMPISRLKSLMAHIEQFEPKVYERLADYAEGLLDQGRKWLGNDKAQLPSPFSVPMGSGSILIKVQPHQVLTSGSAVTIRFFRIASPNEKRSRQSKLLHWLIGELTKLHQKAGKSVVYEIAVLRTGELLPIAPWWSAPKDVTKALNGIASGSTTPTNRPHDCVRCRHFAYCPA